MQNLLVSVAAVAAAAVAVLQGPTYSLKVSGGSCTIDDDGKVDCAAPTVALSSTPYECNLPFRQAAKLEVSQRNVL